MILRDTILIMEEGNTLSNGLQSRIRELGYFSIRVGKSDGLVPLLNCRDRVGAFLFVDEAHKVLGKSCMELKILKAISYGTPVLFSTAKNDPEKEKQVRHLGLFYYHTADTGLDDLAMALGCAVRKSVMTSMFLMH